MSTAMAIMTANLAWCLETSYKNKRGEMPPYISLFFSRNVDEQLTDVHVGQLGADAAGVLIPYLQRNEVSLVTAFDLR